MNFSVNFTGRSLPNNRFPKLAVLFLALTAFFLAAQVQAQTWLASPGSNDFNTGTNWDTSTVPNSASAIATFGTSSTTSLSLSANVNVGAFQYNSGASSYNISNSVSQLWFFNAAGIVDNSGVAQTLTNGGEISFANHATAGDVIINNNVGGNLFFNNGTSAANSTINNQGTLAFQGNNSSFIATAGNAVITNTGTMDFFNFSNAGASTITTNSGGSVNFYSGAYSGSTACFVLNGTGFLDVSGISSPLTVGSIEGSGSVSLGSQSLITGANNLSTGFSGVIADGGGFGGTGGFLTKVGTGTLTLSGNNTYTGGTTITGGTLVVDTGGTLGLGPVTNSANLTFNNGVTVGSITINSGGGGSSLNFLNGASAGSATINNSNLGTVAFHNTSTAANAWIYSGSSSTLEFLDSSTAGNAWINNNNNDNVLFYNISDAGSATIINHAGNGLYFYNGSSAANSTINNQGYLYVTGDNATTIAMAGSASISNTGAILFENYSTAGSATIMTGNGGYVGFNSNSTGGTARFEVNGTGYMTLSGNSGSSVTVGSIEGSGSVTLSNKNLTTGTNNLSTTFSGVISDSGGGSLTKLGTGTFNLSGNNTYTGGTTILAGTLNVDTGGAPGTGPVSNLGILQFIDNATAGALTISNNGTNSYSTNGSVNFLNNASAGSATINSFNSGTVDFYNASTAANAWMYSGYYSQVYFYNNSTGGNAWLDSNNYDYCYFNNNATAGNLTLSNAGNSYVDFYDASTAGNSTINNQTTAKIQFAGDSATTIASAGSANITNTGIIDFFNYSTAGSATITTNSGGVVYFYSNSTGGTARLSFNGTGYLDISDYGGSAVTVGSIEGSGAVSLGSKDLTTGANNLNTTFSGILSDGGDGGGTGGSLTKVGTGTLSLTVANIYTGGTTLSGGTLNLGNTDALGTNNLNMLAGTTLQSGLNNLVVANNVALNGADTFDTNDHTTTLSGVVSGTGSLTETNTGVLILSGTNTYGGGTTVSVGTLGLANNNALGTGNLNLQAGTTLQAGVASLAVTNNVSLTGADSFDSNGYNSTFSGILSGTGSLAVTNSGGPATLTLSAANTYSGGTYIGGNNNLNQGTVNVDTGGTLGTGPVTNYGILSYINNANAGTVSIGSQNYYSYVNFLNNASAGSASIYNSNGSHLTFFNNSTAYWAWIYSGYNGYVDFYDSSKAGSATIYTANSDQVIFHNSSSAQNAAIINAGGSLFYFDDGSTAANSTILNETGSGLDFVGGSATTIATAGNANITNIATINFFDYSTAGNATITTNSGGYVYFHGSADGGTARFALNGTGFLDISLDTGSSVTVGSIEGSGSVSLGGLGLVTGANNLNTTFAGVLTDGGSGGGASASLTKIGTGSFTLSGANSYTGGTDIEAGTLVVANGSALGTGNVTVNGGTFLVSGPRIVNIGSNYTQAAGGTLQLGLGGTGAGQFDTLNITGTATLAGTLNLVPYNNFLIHDNETFTILTASSVSGTFTTVTNGVLGDSVSVVYNATDVVLDTIANAPTFEALGTTANQKNIGTTLDNLVTQSNNSALIYYLNSQTNAALPGIYDQLSPANLTPLYQMGFSLAQVEAGLAGGRVSQLFGDSLSDSRDISWNGQGPLFAADMPTAQEAGIAKDLEPQRWGVFVNGLGNFGTVTGDGNGPGYQYSTGGAAAGVDYRFSKNFAAGLLLGYSSSGTSQSTGSVNATGGQAGLYAGWKQESLHIEALAAGGLNNYTTSRNALGGTATGSTQGQQVSGQLSAGYDLKAGDVNIGPYVSGQYTSVSFNSFTETGSMAPLSFGAQSEGYLTSDLGATANRKWDLGGGVALSPMVSAAWEHVYQGNLDSLSANFGSGSNFTVNGPAMGTDAAVLGAGVKAILAKGFSAYAQYQGKLALTNYTEQNLSGGVNIGF